MARNSIYILEADRPTGLATVRALFNYGSVHSSHRIRITAGVSRKASDEIRKKLADYGANVYIIDDPNNIKFNDDVQKLMITLHPERLDAGFIYLEAALRDKVPFILLQSVVMADERKDYVGKKFGELEAKFNQWKERACIGTEHTHRNWTILRTGVYDHYLLAFKDCIKKGILDLPIGDGKFAPIAVEDVGVVAAEIIEKSEKYYFKTYTVTGHELTSGENLAHGLSQALGYQIKYKPSSDPSHVTEEHIKESITSPVEASTVSHLFELIKEDKFNYVSPHSTDIEKWKPKTVEEFFLEHKDELQQTK
ncbi:3549_t:CDS:2 [Diversispora eburnea]|uniref:3549_t:CDS:1 n=1 Tax=Diversispora eburnea TaxID=1213867 RepID=A0A9N8Z0X2_9GLOM|nr:3549_t:CDS:2 [Diversispora eburnea]